MRHPFGEYIPMKICDLCKRVAVHLNESPGHPNHIEVCDDCRGDFLARLRKLERRLAESKAKWYTEALEEWMRERSPKESSEQHS
jgi:hypothetical protein